jgi:hypothetical protein
VPGGDLGIDDVAVRHFQRRHSAFLVSAHEAAETDDVCSMDSG